MGRFIYENVVCNRIIDGDTVVLTINAGFYNFRHKEKDGVSYRLARINAPELKQPGGAEARDALTAFLGAPLRVETLPDPDKFGRFLVEVETWLADNWFNVNDAMVGGGYAAYKEY